MSTSWITGIAGGALIGVASALLLLTHGRVAGVSGIASGVLAPIGPDHRWRLAFLAGLVSAGLIGAAVAPEAIGAPARGLPIVILGGLLVGFGAHTGGGCTSGHGVCGVGRLAPRSLVAVAVFMTTGIATAVLAGRWA